MEVEAEVEVEVGSPHIRLVDIQITRMKVNKVNELNKQRKRREFMYVQTRGCASQY